MSWREWMRSRRLLAEEFVLVDERLAVARVRAEEDAQFEKAAERLRRVK